MQNQITQEITIITAEKRIDSFLAKQLNIPKNQVLQLIKNSLVFLNHQPCTKGGIALKPKDIITILAPQTEQKPLIKKTNLYIQILYEDTNLLVLNKPQNLVVHHAPSVKEETLVDWLQAKNYNLSTLSGKQRYGIVHRLDKDTTGSIVIAKDNYTHNHLAEQLKSREMGRYYLAIINPPIKENTFIECHMGRNPKNRLKMSKLNPQRFPTSRFSKSLFIPITLSKNQDLQLVAIKLFTGRTHQIRVHLESISRHILGDTLYGYKGRFQGRIMLHAFLLYLTHPTSQKKLLFQAPVFDDMLELLEKNFDKEKINGFLQNPENLLHLF